MRNRKPKQPRQVWVLRREDGAVLDRIADPMFGLKDTGQAWAKLYDMYGDCYLADRIWTTKK